VLADLGGADHFALAIVPRWRDGAMVHSHFGREQAVPQPDNRAQRRGRRRIPMNIANENAAR
jgi:hypothetical protein